MPEASKAIGTAPGKAILCGEHAVVYGRPAIAIPVTQVRAEAIVRQDPAGDGVHVLAEDIGAEIDVDTAPEDDPLAVAVRLALAELGVPRPQGWRISLRSTIPIASGMGSGAAVSVALIRALARAAGHELPTERVSQLAFEVERIHHGTPSGVDNTVVAYEQPVYFVRGQPPIPLQIGARMTLIIADTGIRSPTRETVAAVRERWQADRRRYERIFDEIGELVDAVRVAIEGGHIDAIGPLLNRNHELLSLLDVSCPALDRLVDAARAHGALGAKLIGGGRGGNMIALAPSERVERIAEALRTAGAARVVITEVRPGAEG
ncbi:MAG: mevalonate kinase [Anaerolineae bacterium]